MPIYLLIYHLSVSGLTELFILDHPPTLVFPLDLLSNPSPFPCFVLAYIHLVVLWLSIAYLKPVAFKARHTLIINFCSTSGLKKKIRFPNPHFLGGWGNHYGCATVFWWQGAFPTVRIHWSVLPAIAGDTDRSKKKNSTGLLSVQPVCPYIDRNSATELTTFWSMAALSHTKMFSIFMVLIWSLHPI